DEREEAGPVATAQDELERDARVGEEVLARVDREVVGEEDGEAEDEERGPEPRVRREVAEVAQEAVDDERREEERRRARDDEEDVDPLARPGRRDGARDREHAGAEEPAIAVRSLLAEPPRCRRVRGRVELGPEHGRRRERAVARRVEPEDERDEPDV